MSDRDYGWCGMALSSHSRAADWFTGFTASSFDLLHAGHILMLKEASEQCDHLIVGLHIDPSVERPEKNKPIQSLEERMIQLEGCKYVDEIHTYTTEAELESLLNTLPIEIRIIGEEYKGKAFTGSRNLWHETYYNSRDHEYSTTELRQRINNEPV